MRRLAAAAHTRIGADSIHAEEISVGPLSGGRELAGFAARRRRDHYSGRKLEQAEQAASVERQPLNLIPADQGSDRSIFAMEQRRGAFHRDGLLHAADNQFEIRPTDSV